MQGLKHHSVHVTNLVRDAHNRAHDASGICEAIGGRFNDGDAQNFMAVLEDLSVPEKHAIIEWLHRTME
jgi:hypothetical protein